MGFFKKLFSLGGKKGKGSKRHEQEFLASRPYVGDGVLHPPLPAKDPELAASRLLRSSSAKFSVVSEVDYSALPPIRESNTRTVASS